METNYNKLFLAKPYKSSECVFRFTVPDDKVAWDVQFVDYQPFEYNSAIVKGQSWAASEDFKTCKFNQVDGEINRKSHMG